MSLLAAVADWEARQGGETRPETPSKQAEHVFHQGGRCSDPVKHAQPQKFAVSAPCFTVSSPRARNTETSQPQHLLDGLAKLQSGWQPKSVNLSDSRVVVDNMRRLVSEGWAANALALGWAAQDLFGIGRGGSDEWLSLAVWLDGRTITVMDDHRAFTAEGAVYYLERWGRRNTVFAEPILLRELGQ
jgi:hypothetical protein